MIRQALFAAALLAASTGAFATGFGHVERHVERHVLRPVEHLSISIGSLLHDGFNVTYGIGGHRHIAPRHSSRVIVVPPPARVVHRHESRHGHWNGHDHGRRAWREHDRHDHRRGWDDRRGGGNRWDDDHRGRDRQRSRH